MKFILIFLIVLCCVSSLNLFIQSQKLMPKIFQGFSESTFFTKEIFSSVIDSGESILSDILAIKRKIISRSFNRTKKVAENIFSRSEKFLKTKRRLAENLVQTISGVSSSLNGDDDTNENYSMLNITFSSIKNMVKKFDALASKFEGTAASKHKETILKQKNLLKENSGILIKSVMGMNVDMKNKKFEDCYAGKFENLKIAIFCYL